MHDAFKFIHVIHAQLETGPLMCGVGFSTPECIIDFRGGVVLDESFILQWDQKDTAVVWI